MAERETIILDLQVEQGSAIQELERTKKSIIQIKQEQTELTKAYKAGNVTLEEYVSETVRLEAILKKQQSTYTNTQKSVTGVKTKMDDLIKSNQNLNKSLEQGLNNATLFGTNLGGLRASFTALANPITAAVGVVGALGAAYTRSTIGAKDLEFASNQLSAATTILTNNFAALISGTQDGEGILSRLTTDALAAVDSFTELFGGTGDLVEQSKEAALALENLEDLAREETKIRTENNERLADNQELMTRIQDSQTDINEKQHLAGEIIDNLVKNEDALLAVKNEQLKILQTELERDKENEKLQQSVLDKNNEISTIKRDTQRRIEAINRLESNVLDIENKKTKALEKQNSERRKAEEAAKSELDRNARIAKLEREQEGARPLGGTADPFGLEDFKNQEIKLDNERTKRFEENTEKQEDELKRRGKAYKDYIDNQIQLTEDNFNALAQLFSDGSDARRLFGLAAIGVDTAQAIASLTAASEANPANAFTFGGAGVAQYASGIIRILANIAAAKEFLGGSFAGGADFVTTKPTMIMVGDNPGNRERVTVEPLSGRGKSTYNPNSGFAAFAGGGSMTFDGARDLAVQNVQQSLATVNAIKRMPIPVVSVKEITKTQNRVRVKENISSR